MKGLAGWIVFRTILIADLVLVVVAGFMCRPPVAWGHWESGFASSMGPPRGEFRQQHGTTLSPVMGPPRSIHQRRRR